MKRGCMFLLICVVGLFLFSTGFVLAADNVTNNIDDETQNTDLEELQEEYVDEEIVDAGLTPDSAFYSLQYPVLLARG